MQTKRVKCPTCGVVLDVKNSKNETLKQINCPQCNTLLQVMFVPAQEPLTAKTFYAPKQTRDNAATQLASKAGMGQEPISTEEKQRAELVFQGQSYPLSEGVNVIGRCGTTSKATVQIKTNDLYMSRQHAQIEVTTLADGKIKAVLSNYQNKNQTTIDGQAIEADDKIRLADGNAITMGKTTVTFKLS